MSDLKTYMVYSNTSTENTRFMVRAHSPEEAVETYLYEAINDIICVDLDKIPDNKFTVVHFPEIDQVRVLNWHGPDIRWTIDFSEMRKRIEKEAEVEDDELGPDPEPA